MVSSSSDEASPLILPLVTPSIDISTPLMEVVVDLVSNSEEDASVSSSAFVRRSNNSSTVIPNFLASLAFIFIACFSASFSAFLAAIFASFLLIVDDSPVLSIVSPFTPPSSLFSITIPADFSMASISANAFNAFLRLFFSISSISAAAIRSESCLAFLASFWRFFSSSICSFLVSGASSSRRKSSAFVAAALLGFWVAAVAGGAAVVVVVVLVARLSCCSMASNAARAASLALLPGDFFLA